MMLSDVCLSDVCRLSVAYVRSAGGVCGRPAGWRVLADGARLGRPGSRLPLRASVAGLGGGISWRPPAYRLFYLEMVHFINAARPEQLYRQAVSEMSSKKYSRTFFGSNLSTG